MGKRLAGVSRLAVVLVAVSLLWGCGSDRDDLNAYIARIKSNPGSKIDDIPEVQPYPRHEYSSAHLKDPFQRYATGAESTGPTVDPEKDMTNCPDPNRPRQILEDYALDSLRMVGILAQDGITYALVRSPEGTVHRVKAGDFVGLNHGQIKSIGETKIEVTEILSNQRGCELRSAAMTLEGLR